MVKEPNLVVKDKMKLVTILLTREERRRRKRRRRSQQRWRTPA